MTKTKTKYIKDKKKRLITDGRTKTLGYRDASKKTTKTKNQKLYIYPSEEFENK